MRDHADHPGRFKRFIKSGDDSHTALQTPLFYTQTVNGVSLDVFFWGNGTGPMSSRLYNPATDGVISNGTQGGEPITVIWYVEVPPGTAEGMYSTSITYKIQHDTG